MQQKEYLAIDLSEQNAKNAQAFEAMLNDLGSEGWAPTTLNYGTHAIFVRDKADDPNAGPKSVIAEKIRRMRDFTKRVVKKPASRS